jgi:type IV fimbrial biogenesis protein FimT
MSNRGFTLLEALVVLALLAVLLSLAAPSLQGLRQKHQMQSQAEQLQASLLLARSEALRRQQRVTLCARASAAHAGPECATVGTWAQGWVVFVDGNDSGRREPAETVLQLHEALPGFLTLQGNNTVDRYISYGPQGRSQSTTGAFQAGTLTLCGAGQAHVWRVVINAVGKPRLEKAERQEGANC